MGFDELLGQPRVVATLRRAMDSGRLAHAYLFVGSDGVGRKTAARLLAMALNCLSGAGDACGVCGQCAKIRKGTHPDFIMIEPEKDFITIDQVRALQASMAYRPYEGKCRVTVLAPADSMNLSSQNALLKTLEEPPARNLLILVTTSPDRLLRTIASRCHRIVFGLMPRQLILATLLERGVEPKEADLLSRLCEGSLGRALSLVEGDLGDMRERVSKGMEALIESGRDGIWEFAERLAEGDMESFDESLQMITTWLRDALLLRSGAEEERIINIDRADALGSMARRFDEDSLMSAVGETSDLKSRLRFYPNRQLALLNLGLALTRPRPRHNEA